MKILRQRNTEKYILHNAFHHSHLAPIGKYVNWKIENGQWDDYNELYHAAEYFEKLRKSDGIWFETHTIERGASLIGVLFIVGGAVETLELHLQSDAETTLLLKYFHIAEKGKGMGSFWLQSVIFPTYLKRGYEYLHVNSSHPKSFKFYERLGTPIGRYEKQSDNGLYLRTGSSFLIGMGPFAKV